MSADRSDKQGHILYNFTLRNVSPSHFYARITCVNSLRLSAGSPSDAHDSDRLSRRSLTLISGSLGFARWLFSVRHLAFGIIQATTRGTRPGVNCGQGVRPKSPIYNTVISRQSNRTHRASSLLCAIFRKYVRFGYAARCWWCWLPHVCRRLACVANWEIQ